MRDAFGTVLLVVVIVSAVAAVWAAIGSGRVLEQIGRGGLALDHDSDQPRAGGAGGSAARAERDAEIRQLLEARNARRAARGQPPLDVEAELARLTAPQVDAAVEAEVRQLVDARNARRVRAGRPPLDVETEVARSLAELRDLPPV